jgi:hypothetical protein
MLGNITSGHNSRADKSTGLTSKNRGPRGNCHYVHTAIDGYLRLAYCERLADECKDTLLLCGHAPMHGGPNGAALFERS